jgi:hypothetical protein
MAETPPLTPADYDPWQVASPLQLLTLLHRLGMTSRVIAGWCGVPPTHISMWLHGKRSVPLRYASVLHLRASETLKEADRLNAKEAAAQPTAALHDATRAEFTALVQKWKLEVLYGAGTLHKGLVQQYQALGAVLQPPFTPAKREAVELMTANILAKYDVLVTLQPEVPSGEQELIERLTQAHEAAEGQKQQRPE